MHNTLRTASGACVSVWHFNRLLTHLAAVVLVATGSLKLVESLQRHPHFREPDPVIGIVSNRQLMVAAGLYEIAIGCFLWFGRSLRHRGLVLLWFCSVILIYKGGRLLVKSDYPCSCLGLLTNWLQLSRASIEVVTWMVIAFLLATELLALSEKRRPAGKSREDEDFGE